MAAAGSLRLTDFGGQARGDFEWNMEKSNCRRETGDGKMQTGNRRTEKRKSRPPKSPLPSSFNYGSGQAFEAYGFRRTSKGGL